MPLQAHPPPRRHLEHTPADFRTASVRPCPEVIRVEDMSTGRAPNRERPRFRAALGCGLLRPRIERTAEAATLTIGTASSVRSGAGGRVDGGLLLRRETHHGTAHRDAPGTSSTPTGAYMRNSSIWASASASTAGGALHALRQERPGRGDVERGRRDTSEQAYKNIPFYLISAGATACSWPSREGLLRDRLRGRLPRQFSVPGERLEYYLIGGASPKDVLRSVHAS